jgi:hypothetical protein
MNISHEHKIIWWAPERCGTKATAHIFSKLGFEYFIGTDETIKTITDDGINYQSHNIEYPEKYNDYKIICSIRNPYDRMLSIFSNFTNVGTTFVYTKNNHQKLVNTFESFIREMLLYNKVTTTEDLEKRLIQKSYLYKYRFESRIPDFFIKMESLEEDLGKLDFVRESEIWKSGYIRDYLKHNPHINKKPFKFNDVYTFESAKRVYEYHKKQFIISDYDPFSFTRQELSNEEKMKFIHDIL